MGWEYTMLVLCWDPHGMMYSLEIHDSILGPKIIGFQRDLLRIQKAHTRKHWTTSCCLHSSLQCTHGLGPSSSVVPPLWFSETPL